MSTLLIRRKSWMRFPSQPTLRYWLVWMLCMCAWRGPVPIVHCHDGELACATLECESDWLLAEHVAACHSGGHEPSDEMGWHVHFVLPSSSDTEIPLAEPILAELIAQDVDGSGVSVPVSGHTIDPFLNFIGPFTQPSLSPTAPKLIPLAPPRSRPSRVTPRIYYCVAQC